MAKITKNSLLFLLLCYFSTHAQYKEYAKKIVDTLAGKYMAGRGYVENGDAKAAKFIKNEFKRLGLKKYSRNYYQPFYFSVNTFPDIVQFVLDDDTLRPGVDYIIDPSSPSISFTGEIAFVNDSLFNSTKFIENLFSGLYYQKALCITALKNKELNSILEEIQQLKYKPALLIVTQKKLTWSVSTSVSSIPVVEVTESILSLNTKIVQLKIKSEFKIKHKTQNVIAFKKGKLNPDTCLVFTAHYDHLGKMGKQALFNGANDNASGVAMLLSLANYYSQPKNSANYSVVFMAFAGEEAGLIGSKFYTENPLFNLSAIKFLVNLDLMGTGDDGITVVNATEFKPEFELLQKINAENNYCNSIKKRGKAANSDHYWFSENKVPAFFIYTNGLRMDYHDVYDVRETLPMDNFDNLFNLLIDFSKEIQH